MTEHSELAIATQGLSKSFGAVNAVMDVDLRVRRGEIYGFLGRNGAGKTTTIRMLLGLVRPTAGTISILGCSRRDDRRRVLARVGYFVESAVAYAHLTVRENLEIQRRLTGSPRPAVDRAIELLKLGEYENRQARHLSLGNRQRLSLARALLHSPELLILDEPANGLDPAGIVEIRALLRTLADEQGITVFMSSHLLDEVEHLADRVGIVHDGRLVEEVDYRLLQQGSTVSVEIDVDNVARAESVLRSDLGRVDLVRRGESTLRVAGSDAAPSRIARVLVNAGIGLDRLVAVTEDLEQHFLRLTADSGRGGRS